LLSYAPKNGGKAGFLMPEAQISLSRLQDRSFTAPYGQALALSPLVTRLLAPNPGPFTFRGTGVYLVGAPSSANQGGAVAVIDPGPLLEGHMAALQRAIGPRKVSHILITHTHRDHSESADALKSWSGAQTFAFGPQGAASTGEEADDTNFVPDVRLKDGDVIQGDGFALTALHTPGHASNHLCFALQEEGALFTGDHVMGWSSSVIAPPDGDMAAYLAGLRRLIERRDVILYPTHGAPVTEPALYLEALLQHRLAREEQILSCLARGVTAMDALVAEIYPGLDPVLKPAAALTIRAHLNKLRS
jgi:glyoxylase-like metal-dependent hydrolase (beta-lactamase superfamily II)